MAKTGGEYEVPLGPTIAEELTDFFGEERNIEALNELAAELTIEDAARAETADSPIAGRTVVFTGTLETMSRPASWSATRPPATRETRSANALHDVRTAPSISAAPRALTWAARRTIEVRDMHASPKPERTPPRTARHT